MSIRVLFLVIARGKRHIQRGVVFFLMVGHTHNNIDASFSCWSMKLYEVEFPTIPLLMKSDMDLDNVHVNLHMIEEVSNFKAFIKSYMLKEVDRLVGYTKTQQFCFYIRNDSILAMQFKFFVHIS